MRRVEQIMGMPITIDVAGCEEESVFNAAFGRLKVIDERFSTYKTGSEVSLFTRTVLVKRDLPRSLLGKRWSAELKAVVKACIEAERQTDGYFSAWYDKKFDPSGYVKGWAIAEAGKEIEKHSHKTYCIGAGGDVLARSAGKKAWNIAIQDPRDSSKILDLLSIFEKKKISNKPAPHQNLSGAVGNRIAEHQVFGAGLSISNGAVATSGSYERGRHIINPKTKKPADELLSVTVTGPDIIQADILATAVFAAGRPNPSFLRKYPGYKILAIKN